MCCDCLCGCIYKVRCWFFKLMVIMWVLDLVFTIYLMISLSELDPFACCTDNENFNICSYDDIGGASNIGVTTTGYCYRKDTSFDCEGSLSSCASTDAGVGTIAELCGEDILDEVAYANYTWLFVILIIKVVGLLFNLTLEFRDWISNCKNKKEDGEEDAQATQACCASIRDCACENCQKCMCATSILVLRALFLIFGTVTTVLALWLLNLTNAVTYSKCSFIGDASLESDCRAVEAACTLDGDENYYNVAFPNFNIEGPCWLDFALNILGTFFWAIRLIVMRHFLSSTGLVDV